MELLRTIPRFLLDLFFPIICLGCHAEGAWVCDTCLTKIPPYAPHTCIICKSPTPSMLCDRCFPDPHIDSILCFTRHIGLARRMAHELKYESITALAPRCAQLMAELPRLQGTVIVTAVPLHTKRLRARGFNQAELIARHYAKRINTPFVHTLSRIRSTRQQVGQSRDERCKNIAFAFTALPQVDIRASHIILIDDVFTTGATVSDAARALKNAGAASVHVFTFSHG